MKIQVYAMGLHDFVNQQIPVYINKIATCDHSDCLSSTYRLAHKK